MTSVPATRLNPEKALIFRITHIRNLPWIFRNGLCCSNHPNHDPQFHRIGHQQLIEARAERPVPVEPGGVLADYVPFYFTPFSPMLLNIVTGRNVLARPKSDLVVMVSSLHRAHQLECRFVIADRHAYLRNARFTNELGRLADWVPWDLLRARDFSRDPENPDKTERYQAEALMHRYLPVDALLGLVVYNQESKRWVETRGAAERELQVHVRPEWFF
jgi:hypothetical protein